MNGLFPAVKRNNSIGNDDNVKKVTITLSY